MKKSVLVTGASGGIGSEICRKFAKEGYIVGINYFKNAPYAEKLTKEIDGICLPFDVRDGKAVSASVKRFADKAGGLYALVNNAGISLAIKPVIDAEDDDYDNIMDVNVRGVFNCTRAALPYILDSRGSIVNIASMWGVTGGSCEALYSASKGAVIAFTKALAKEYSRSGVRINAVAPGYIETRMNDVLSESDKSVAIEEIPLGRAGKAEEIAECVYFLTEKATFTTGHILDASGGEAI